MNIPQKSVQGSQFIGAASIIITAHNNYDNNLVYNDAGEVTRIEMQGTGGRAFSQSKNAYELVQHQALAQNYALTFSCENDLPIRVFNMRKDKRVVYLGLWTCVGFIYAYENKSIYKTYKFVLEPIK